jgi:hypothetical protein
MGWRCGFGGECGCRGPFGPPEGGTTYRVWQAVGVDFALGRWAGMETVVPTMRGWKLQELIDFEVALAAWDGRSRPEGVASEGSRGGVFKSWLEAVGGKGTGRSWVSSIGWAARLLGWLSLVMGFAAAWGCFDARHEGVNVLLLLLGTLVMPWLFLLGSVVVWIFRPVRGGVIGQAIRLLANRIAGKRGGEMVARIEGNPELAKALGWRVAADAQGVVADFHIGAVLGICAMVFFRKVGFFWETSTEAAMERSLEVGVRVLSAPWASFAPRFMPDIAATRRDEAWAGGGHEWMMFLVLALAFWGIVPRWLLLCFAQVREWRTLREPVFQSPAHRKLWRVLTGVRRGEDPQGLADGALVIDLGGISPDREALRPFFLRHLRMNPVAWETLDVLDSGREAAARAALEKAPAGIILLAEGWSLAPRRMEETLKKVLDAAGGRRLVVHVADFEKDGRPGGVKPDERAGWEAFADGQKGLEFELSIHEEDRTWAAE